MNTEVLTRHRKVLIATAHGDDLEMHFSGASQALQEQGSGVFSLVATDGSATTTNYSSYDFVGPKDMAIRRRSESEAAHQLHGIPGQYLALPDGELADSYIDAVAHALKATVLTHDISAIITFSPQNGYCGHSDHQAMGQSALRAQQILANTQPIDLFFINPDHEGAIRVLVDTQRKLGLLALHETQMSIYRHPDGTYEPNEDVWNSPEMQKYHRLLNEETYDQLLTLG